MKVAFGMRAQSATIMAVCLLMITQVVGVVIFSGGAKAYNSNSPFDIEITSTTVQPSGANYEIVVEGQAGSPGNRTVSIKLDGNLVGTTQSDSYGQWTYTITGITQVGAKTVTASAVADTLQTADRQISIPTLEGLYFNNNTYTKFGFQPSMRRFGVGAEAVEDLVHQKMYHNRISNLYVSSNQVDIQDLTTGEFVAKITLPYESVVLLGDSNNYVYAVSGAYIVKISTTTNQVSATIPLTGVTPSTLCYGERGVALSPDEQTLYVRNCTDIKKYNAITGEYISSIVSGHPEGSGIYGDDDRAQIQLSPDGQTLYSYSNQDNVVYGLDVTTGSIVGSYTDGGVCSAYTYHGPTNIALSPDGSKLYVQCYLGNTTFGRLALYALDTTTWAPLVNSSSERRIVLTSVMSNMQFNADGSELYVGGCFDFPACTAPKSLKIINTTTQDTTNSATVLEDSSLVYSQTHDQVWLPDSNYDPAAGTYGQYWDIQSNTVGNITQATAGGVLPRVGMHIGPNSLNKYTSNGYDSLEFSTLTQDSFETPTTLVTVGNLPRGVVADSTDTNVYVANMGDGTISKLATSSKSVTDTISVAGYPYGLALSPDNSRLYVTHLHSSLVSVINTTTNAVIGTIAVGSTPAGITTSPDGARLYVANHDSNTVSVINTATSTVVATLNVGMHPTFLRTNNAGDTLYVANNGSGSSDTSISVIDTTTPAVTATWQDSSFADLGANNIEVSLDDSTVYLTTRDGQNCTENRPTTAAVGINASTGIDLGHPAIVSEGNCTSDSYSYPYDYDFTNSAFGFGRAVTSYVATTSVQVQVTAVLGITTTSLPAGIVGTAYSQAVQTQNAQGSLSFGRASGSLPPGVTISSNGTIAGTPTTAGTYNFTVWAYDGVTLDTQLLQIVVTQPIPPMNITTTSLPNGTVDLAYDQTVETNSSNPFIYVSSGSLPPGLAIDFYGRITGTPTAVGTYAFAVDALDNSGNNTGFDSQALQIIVDDVPPPPFTISAAALPDGMVSETYQGLIESDSQTPVAYNVQSGSLPTGLSLLSDGSITGTPTTEGVYTFTVFGDNGASTDTQDFTITIDAALTNDLPDESQEPTIEDPEEPTDPEDPIIEESVVEEPVNQEQEVASPLPTTSQRTSPLKAPSIIRATPNTLFALAKRIPEPIAIGFPWLLLILALVLVGIQYYQVHSESAATKRMQASVANQQRLVEEQNNFVALSTHYLHTPLTVMEGEISLMVKAGTLTQQQATKLQATLASLNTEAEAALAEEEQGKVE